MVWPEDCRVSPVAVHLVVDVPVLQLQQGSQVVDMPVGVSRLAKHLSRTHS